MTHPLLYQVNTRCWLWRLGAEAGRRITLANVPEAELERWSEWGLTHLWLMGVWASGPRARALALTEPQQRRVYDEVLPGWRPADVDGSPYAIADYHLAPALGRDDDLAEFRHRLGARSIRLILDFVPNHLGVDHAWVRERPDLFVQSPEARYGTFLEPTAAGPRWLAHGRDPYFPPWVDTVQLDYRLAATHTAMLQLLASVAARCDGVRCDMAMLLLGEVFSRTWKDFPPAGHTAGPKEEFWARAIREVRRAHPGFQFLAEVYWGLEPRLQDLGFDYTYDKELTDQVLAREAATVQAHLAKQVAEGRLAAGIHFLENHDERRVASVLSAAEHQAAALLTLGLPGMRFLHEGQLDGARLRVPVQLSRRLAEPPQAPIQALYRELLAVVGASAVGRGMGELLSPRPIGNTTCAELILVQWEARPGALDLVAVNLAPAPRECRAPLRLHGWEAEPWRVLDLISGATATHAAGELGRQGLFVDLPAHGTALYQCRAEA